MDLGLADRTYLVTGGSRGLGYATAAALVEDGANVVLSSRDPAAVAAAAATLGERAVGLALDNADPSTPEVLISTAFERWGRLDGALVSVGGPPPGPATGVGEEQWRQAFESVFLGTLRLATAVGARVGEGGAIALVLSSSVRSPLPNLAISNGLRPGLAMAAKDLADELGPSGVRVFGLLPGRILTDRTRQTVGGDPEALRRAELLVPLRRLGRPEEFGRVAAMLLSPAASYVTGCVVPVDGGMIRTL
ncbi:SDR family oxidoreductase [Acidimicrobiaceae bacterium USS-CC1]|uniref:SDR family oxidoreductase n=1 Tax=Acidiferrimicrobium australe TaxID=2664430 RepID=A0ABW9QZ93_9ACTN|nr:SDR family oxidoreductase [Acidiferrimicrobium australe]